MTQAAPDSVEARLAALGETLPDAPAPLANYVPAVISGRMLFVSGQISKVAGQEVVGVLGAGLDLEAGRLAAKLCGLAVIAQARAALDGDLSRVSRVLKLGGFVNSAPDFTDHPAVVNAASDLMVAAFGDAGRHARAAVGVASLPFGVAVEVEAIFEID